MSEHTLRRMLRRIEPADAAWYAQAEQRLGQLAMPYWAMGRVMDLAREMAGMTRSLAPAVQRKAVVTMVADHGVVAEGVSCYPQTVTAQMMRNFVAGGAAINAMARLAEAKVFVVDMGTAERPDESQENGRGVIPRRIGAGTGNIAREPAMTRQQAIVSVRTGLQFAEELAATTDVFGTGEMGIGNTTPSAAIAAVLTGQPPSTITGRGTGIEDTQLAHKVRVVGRAIERHTPDADDPLDVLAKVGGFEIGGLAGLILGAAAHRKPVVLDGYIATAAAMLAADLCPACKDYVIAGHRSAEPGHGVMLDHLGMTPLLDLNMRLGEGTGATLAMHIVDAAARILTQVHTFEEAAVSTAVPRGESAP